MDNREFYKLYDLDYNKAGNWDGSDILVLHGGYIIMKFKT